MPLHSHWKDEVRKCFTLIKKNSSGSNEVSCNYCSRTFTVSGLQKYISHVSGWKYKLQYCTACDSSDPTFLELRNRVRENINTEILEEKEKKLQHMESDIVCLNRSSSTGSIPVSEFGENKNNIVQNNPRENNNSAFFNILGDAINDDEDSDDIYRSNDSSETSRGPVSVLSPSEVNVPDWGTMSPVEIYDYVNPLRKERPRWLGDIRIWNYVTRILSILRDRNLIALEKEETKAPRKTYLMSKQREMLGEMSMEGADVFKAYFKFELSSSAVHARLRGEQTAVVEEMQHAQGENQLALVGQKRPMVFFAENRDDRGRKQAALDEAVKSHYDAHTALLITQNTQAKLDSLQKHLPHITNPHMRQRVEKEIEKLLESLLV